MEKPLKHQRRLGLGLKMHIFIVHTPQIILVTLITKRTLIALKLYSCLGNGMKMCILFADYFCYFFLKKNLVIYAAKVNRYQVPCVCISSYSFPPIPLKLYRCLGHHIVGHNPRIIFVNFSTNKLSHFWGQSE